MQMTCVMLFFVKEEAMIYGVDGRAEKKIKRKNGEL